MNVTHSQLAALAYCDEPRDVREQLEYGTDWRLDHYFDVDGTQGFLAFDSDNNCLLVFRGTDPQDIRDWYVNLDATMTGNPYGAGKTHRGFTQALERVWGNLHNLISNRYPKQIELIGHSQGGALATLAAAALAYHGRDGLRLTTFGSPRVGNKAFVDWLLPKLESCKRYVNCADLITRVPHLAWRWAWCCPPSISIQGVYRHLSQPVYITSGEEVIENPPPGFITFDRLWFHLRHPGQFFSQSVKHHGIVSRYARILSR